MDQISRQQDLIRIVEGLDITPTMFMNAHDKYHALATYLTVYGIDAEVYPQGSFALGTVVRPCAKDENACYDLDCICQVTGTRDSSDPNNLRMMIQNALKDSKVYSDRMTIYDECITISYADINGYGFQIDIVPATDESRANKDRLMAKAQIPSLVVTSIAFPKKVSYRYDWETSNPKGYRAWFEEINKPFSFFSWRNRRTQLFEQNRQVYNSIEEIPQELNRSSVQQVIQLLKYHRDVFFCKYQDGDDTKPISAIITTLVAQIAKTQSPALSTFELLEIVLQELTVYADTQRIGIHAFLQRYGEKRMLLNSSGKWYIANPANPEDNLADKWNENPLIPERFFRWSKAVRSDLVDSLSKDDATFRTCAENAFGKDRVRVAWGDKYHNRSSVVIDPNQSAKPWSKT